ncbi:MAG: carboxymuconolactone decarboxylase family protein [Dehalococcoidia bacterium]
MADQEQYINPTTLETFRKIWGPDMLPPFPRLTESMEAQRPVSAAQGAVLSNPILDLKTRCVIIFSTMVALGFKPEAKLYMQGLRNLGYSLQEIAEMITQIALYAGIPRGVDAHVLLKELVDEDEERAKAKGFFYRFPQH